MGSMLRIGAGSRHTLLLPALLAAALVLACTGDAEEPGRSFYAEIAVEADPSRNDPLARSRVAEGPTGAIRWWYAADPVRWRWEMETSGSIIDDGMVVTLFDGAASWAYDDRSNTYTRGVIPEELGPIALSPIFSAPVGPAHAETLDGFIERWREWDNVLEAVRVGEATILGRETQIVELRLSSGGSVRAFIDPERMFIMRWAADGGDEEQSFHVEVAALDYDTELDAGLFAFSPPPGARETEARDGQSCSGSVFIGRGSFPTVAGFLKPSYVPPDYGAASAGSENASGGCGPAATWALLEASDGAYILLRQRYRPAGIPDAVRFWETADSGLGDVYHQSEDGVLRIVWREGDLVALLEADAVLLEELLRIAESSQLAP